MSVINCLADAVRSGQEAFAEPKGCIATYKSGKGFQYAQSGNLIAPWVAIDFVDTNYQVGNGAAVTVSNLSSASTNPANCAIISSFVFGHSDGCTARITIHDTHGGNFEQFMNHILSSWGSVVNQTNSIYMRVQFGWVKSGCKEPLPASRSPCYTIFVESIESNFTEGKFIFEVTGKDICSPMFEGSMKWEEGGIGNAGIHLVQAMTTFLCDSGNCGPNLKKIRFILGENYEFDANSTFNPQAGAFLFNITTSDAEKRLGRKQAYQAHGKNKIETVRKWLASQPSINNKPWTVKYDPEKEELLIKEHIQENEVCKDDAFFSSISEGTYVVNGGPLSPVLEFNPKIKWPWFVATGGAAGELGVKKANPMGTDGGENPGPKALPRYTTCGAGLITGTQTDDGKLEEGSDAVKTDAEDKANRSILVPPAYQAIAADLVIVGDPTFCPPQFVNGKFCSIVFMNPFFIEKKDGTGPCGDWHLAEPACNKVLSNKGWMIKGVTHQINAGKYTTTINVELLAPGINAAESVPVGGWCKGWKPDQAI